ncbi:cytochrome d ubiquinol oxidase subunit II [Amycolatopsis rhabdoformis]|uniref:Cytochrome d ubiquinol oxidase subunit II n=1 Tax=Amycolatopsis rhabdoformis TaxID=1448059 RepID=A0ABZ1IH14_9PSEU|nr:cytochrome d ubiquinol oxidase subunit II [Amycolatopsis rhabdoformis]WSE33396.1 cytochrome d ubiquinol oxidase subunit II [Amycolatopsis rhabdoformis]
MSTAVAAVLLVAIATYAVFGGADFGAGFWDLTAGGPERGAAARDLVQRSIGPVWEANHVWLIFIFVVTWSAFPEAFQSITLTMFVPLALAAFGIVLRGASFAFRKTMVTVRVRRAFGGLFALSSVLVPFCFGAVAGGIVSGRVPAGGVAGDPVGSWLNPTSLVTGGFAVVAAAYLAAVFLVREARRTGDAGLAGYFRRRAVAGALVAAVVAVIGFAVLSSSAPHVFDRLFTWALPAVVLSVLGGFGALLLLVRGVARGARVLAVVAVACVIFGWGVAQWPYLLPESLTVAAAAAPTGTLVTLLIAGGLAALLVLPGFVLLYVLDQRRLLPEEGVADAADRAGG